MSSHKEMASESFGKALTFECNGQLWACELSKVREIVRVAGITPLPNARSGVAGVINVRGDVLPVVSQWSGRSSMESADESGRRKIVILLRDKGETVGLQVDEVRTLADIQAYDLGEMSDDGLCRVYLSGFGYVPLVDGRILLDELREL